MPLATQLATFGATLFWEPHQATSFPFLGCCPPTFFAHPIPPPFSTTAAAVAAVDIVGRPLPSLFASLLPSSPFSTHSLSQPSSPTTAADNFTGRPLPFPLPQSSLPPPSPPTPFPHHSPPPLPPPTSWPFPPPPFHLSPTFLSFPHRHTHLFPLPTSTDLQFRRRRPTCLGSAIRLGLHPQRSRIRSACPDRGQFFVVGDHQCNRPVSLLLTFTFLLPPHFPHHSSRREAPLTPPPPHPPPSETLTSRQAVWPSPPCSRSGEPPRTRASTALASFFCSSSSC